MADDGGLKIEIDDDLAEEVRATAAAKGVPVETFVRDALARQVFAERVGSDDPDPSVDELVYRHAIETGETMSIDELAPWIKSWGKPDELPAPKWRKSS
jgi:predicted transcriptional regulator